MLTLLGFAAGLVVVASLPYWLPAAILSLRMRIFTRINGDEGIAVPGQLVDGMGFKRIYSHPAACGRSSGAALSDLFWYWLSPGAEMHQEHLEAGEKYDQVARTTRQILAIPRKAAERLAALCAKRTLEAQQIHGARMLRLRELMMPLWAEFYYELVFEEPCPPEARSLIVGNANDVVTALKCCGLRHMEKRGRLTRFLIEKLQAGEVGHALPGGLSTEEKAYYLQGVFFNTAVVQMSEAMVHLFLAIAQHPDVQAKLKTRPQDDRYLDHVIAETLRLYPLFGIAHRITAAEIAVNEHVRIREGSVLCFNYPQFHQLGFENPEHFDPDRWINIIPGETNYIPFGVTANRPCPAQGVALITMRAAAKEMLRSFEFYSSASHTRSIPNRGPCLLTPSGAQISVHRRRALLVWMRLRDRWEDVWRSVVQLVLGTYMVWDARRLRLCARHFDSLKAHVEA